MDELKKQLEKEREVNCEAATKELTNVKLEVESRKHGNETRQRNVEALLTEVHSISFANYITIWLIFLVSKVGQLKHCYLLVV